MLGAMTSFACYNLKNVKTVGYEVLVNRPKSAAYRAPSAPMAAFAVESVIDELAQKIGMNPVEFRIRNAAREGTKSSYGPVYGPIGIGPTLEAAKQHPHMKAPLGKNQGRGMACGFWFNFGGQTCTDLNIGIDGTVTLTVGTVDVGGSRASLSLVAAEELGISYAQVQTVVADTGSLGYNDMTDGSRGTFSSSMATISAARNAIQVLRERAAKTWDIPVDDVVWRGRQGPGQGGEARQSCPRCRSRISRRRQAKRADRSPGTANSWPMAPASRLPPISATSKSIRRPAPPRCCAIPSCRTRERRCIRPMWRGMDQGGAAQGIGWALNEEYVYGEDGRLQNPGFLDYRIPVCSDLPMIDTQILRDPQSESSLWGARRGRDLDRAAPGGSRDCGVECGRGAHDAYSHVATTHPGGTGGITGALMVEVTLWGSLGAAAGGRQKLEIEAKDIRELFRKLAEQHPGLGALLERGIAVSIDGVIYRDTWSKELPKGAEIFLLPRLAGG